MLFREGGVESPLWWGPIGQRLRKRAESEDLREEETFLQMEHGRRPLAFKTKLEITQALIDHKASC